MNGSKRAVVLTVCAAFLIGLLAGYVPQRVAASTLEKRIQHAESDRNKVQQQLNSTQDQLTLSNFAVRSATVLTQTERNDYSSAASNASSLFTDIRRYVDQAPDQTAKDQLLQVLAARDRTIAGLAKADPGVRVLLAQIFQKTQEISTHAVQGA